MRKPDFAGQLISAFVFVTRIVQFLFFLNPKFPASSHLMCLYRPVFSRCGSIRVGSALVFIRLMTNNDAGRCILIYELMCVWHNPYIYRRSNDRIKLNIDTGRSRLAKHAKFITQLAHDVKMTSYQRRCDVMTSHRRRSDVILTSCACWVKLPRIQNVSEVMQTGFYQPFLLCWKFWKCIFLLQVNYELSLIHDVGGSALIHTICLSFTGINLWNAKPFKAYNRA